MDIVAWLGWAVLTVLGVLWSLVWFLISGWVSTLLQIAVLIATIYFLKYGWQRAPAEILRRTRSFGRFFWNWVRAREPQLGTDVEVREVVRVVGGKEFGDINISTLLSPYDARRICPSHKALKHDDVSAVQVPISDRELICWYTVHKEKSLWQNFRNSR